MKKIVEWPVAFITAAVSLIAMCIFDFILSLIYYFIGKVPFLSEIIDYIGDILDLGLTSLFAFSTAIFIWGLGHACIKKIEGKDIKFESSPVCYVNCSFFFVFLAVFLFLGYQFVMLIGGALAAYTADFQGFTKVLLFFKAIKDTAVSVCSEHVILYKIGTNSFILSIINAFAHNYI